MDDKVVFFCILLLIIGLIVCQYFSHNSDLSQIKNSIQNSFQNTTCPTCPNGGNGGDQQGGQEQPPQKITIDVNQNDNGQMMPPINPLREYDYRTLTDPLVPPLKRDDYNIAVIPVATRGYPGGYKKIGTLIDPDAVNTDPYKFLILIGRQKYPGSTQYDYFITENKQDSALKFDLPNLHKELYTDDEITVDELSKVYKVKIDRSLGFEYNPFAY